MKFTPSSNWASIAKSAAADVRWFLYLKKTTALNEAFGTGTWIDVTGRILDWPDIAGSIEWETGQFAADALMFVGVDRDWWNNNIFNATAYVEAKVVLQIGRNGSMATDDPVVFAGFVELQPTVNEDEDTVEFQVATPDLLADRMSAERITTQYIDDNIDGAATSGLILVEIENLFVKDANLASYVLQNGVHVVEYDYNGGSRRARLDGGAWVSLTGAGSYTLANVLDTQRVQVYVKTGTGALPGANASAKIVVTNAGDTLPKVFFHRAHALQVLRPIFTEMGVDTLYHDSIEYTSWDSTQRLTFLDSPPAAGNISGKKLAMVTDGTDLWIAVGNKLYKRVMSTHTYTLKATLNSGDVIYKLQREPSSNTIWIVLKNSTNSMRVRRFTVSGDTLSSEISTANGDVDSFQVVNGEDYCALYVETNTHYIKRIDGSSLAVTTLFTNTALGYSGTDGPAGGMSYVRSGGDFYGCHAADTSFSYNHEIWYEPGTGWVDNGQFNKPTASYVLGAYNASEDRIYFWDPVNFKVKKHPRTSTTATDVLTLGTYDTIHEMGYLSTGYVYFTTHEMYATGGYLKAARVYAVNNSTLVLMNDTANVYTLGHTWCLISPNVYAISQHGMLFAWGSNLFTYIQDADMDGMTVREALNKVLIAFNLQSTVVNKRGFIYRRGNDSGVAQTSGSSITLTPANTVQPLTRQWKSQPAFAIVVLDNGQRVHSYNGTAFDRNVQTDAARLTITNDFIPNEIIKDLAYRMFQFWKTGRDVIQVEAADVAVEYEPFDGATLSGFDEVASATGVVVGTGIRPNGNVVFSLLTPKG